MDLQPLGGRLVLLNVLRRNLTHRKTAGYELHRGQLPILELVLARPGCTQQELAEQLRITPASVAQSTTRLEKAGLIEKRADPDNRRRNCLNATEEGARAASRYRQSFDEVDAETFSGFSEAELVTLSAYLDRMIENINGDGTGLASFPFCWKGEPNK